MIHDHNKTGPLSLREALGSLETVMSYQHYVLSGKTQLAPAAEEQIAADYIETCQIIKRLSLLGFTVPKPEDIRVSFPELDMPKSTLLPSMFIGTKKESPQ